ncbi:unnamed protein product [Linum trigynum]|uniref:Reverse transcriptase zinc-binding domain-containing protein n=1 Tax=Linum trigynum TaxID=586398 RepID=A0AAV2EBE1_9ROSI
MGLPVDAAVWELIDPDLEWWDETLLESCFPSDIVKAIKQIPLRGNEEVDTLVWHNSKSGNYTVREGFKSWLADFLRQEVVETQGEAEVWRQIWKLNIPPKIRHFLWRFMREILPTGVQVHKRYPRRSDRCPFCGLVETQTQTFCECQWVSRIWRRSEFTGLFQLKDDDSFYNWVKRALEKGEVEKFEGWCVLLWYLWKERNAHLFNGAKLLEEEIVVRAKYLLEDYKIHQGRQKEQLAIQERQVWKRPNQGRVSVCTDAGILGDEGAGLGVVIRDSSGRFCLAATKRVPGKWKVEEAEALATEFEAQMDVQGHFPNAVLESDCQVLVQKLQAAH